MTERNSLNWVNLVPEVIRNYNNCIHRMTGMKPVDVTDDSLVVEKQPLKKPKYKVGDLVRISKEDKLFRKKYAVNFSDEIFTINKVNRTYPRTYVLQDGTGKTIEGIFYEPELLKTKVPDLFRIEKVLKKEKNRLLVKFFGYPTAEWISKKSIII